MLPGALGHPRFGTAESESAECFTQASKDPYDSVGEHPRFQHVIMLTAGINTQLRSESFLAEDLSRWRRSDGIWGARYDEVRS